MKKKTKNRALIIIVLIVIIFGITITAINKKITINLGEEKKLIVKYNAMQFKAETDNNNSVLVGKNESISFSKIKSLEDYGNDYIILRDYRVMAYNGKLVDYNGTEYAVYKNENNYVLVCQIGIDGYMEIKISSSQDNVEDIFNSKKVQKILNKMKLE